jgi:acetyl-CoA carboxylase carboxyl transferase alpha subunit
MLTPWQKVQLSRHPERPQTLDYVEALCTDFTELHGDRRHGDDAAIVAGVGFLAKRSIAVVGHQRGHDTSERALRRFGMPRAEGYRKAARLYALAARMRFGLLTLVDTPGAYPGAESEERGIAEAIASCLADLVALPVPIVCVVIGEGGSGGALALAVADVLLVLENSCLAVITPEGCASILSRKQSAGAVERSAASLALTADDLVRLGIADGIVPEPPGGAHVDREATFAAVGAAVETAFSELDGQGGPALRARRRERLRALGRYAFY